MFHFKIIILFLVLMFVPCIASADLERGIEEFNKGNHSVALQELKPVAKAGDAEAQFYLGVMVRNGFGTTASEEKGIKLIKAAAAQGHAKAVDYLKSQFDIDYNPLNVNTPLRSERHDQITRIWMATSAVLLINLIICIILQSNGKLIIYRDYTDAVLTFLGVALTLLVWLGTSFSSLDKSIVMNATIGTGLIALFFILRSTYVHNSNIIFAVMALAAKLFVIALYVAFLICRKNVVNKRDGESLASFEHRKAEAEHNSAVLFLIVTGMFMFLTRAMTKYQYFAPVKEHLSVSFFKVNPELTYTE